MPFQKLLHLSLQDSRVNKAVTAYTYSVQYIIAQQEQLSSKNYTFIDTISVYMYHKKIKIKNHPTY